MSELLEAFRHQARKGCPFVLVLGMSGCGKSSLVRAGLLPRLIRPGVIEGIGMWRRALMRPSDASGDLLDGLATSLLREHAIPELAVNGPEELGRLLRDSPAAVGPLIRSALSLASQEVMSNEKLPREPASRLILTIDQLEEIFTLERVTPSERKAFTAAIQALVQSGSVWGIATLRSDFYARLAEIPPLLELKEGEGQYDLMAPASAEIGRMIRQPAQMAGLQFEENKETEEQLDDVLRDAASANPEALPLLEFTLEELYKDRSRENVLTFTSYRGLGGLEGALARRAEEIFSNLPTEVQVALPSVLSALVAIRADDRSHTAGRRVPVGIATGTPECRKLVEAFIAARLFVADRADDGTEVVGIAREALLSHWKRIKDWIIRNEDLLRIRSRIAVAARLWEEQGRMRNFLLPTGKALDEGRRLLGTLRNVLSADEVEYIEASSGEALHRSRRKIAARASLVFAFLLLVGVGIYSWDAYFRVHTEYYTSFSKRWGQFEGVGPITREASNHRNISLEFLRRGRRGHVEEVRLVDGFGKCPMSPAVMYFGDNGIFGFDAQECRQVLEYQGNELKKQKAYGRSNLPLYELSYVTQNRALISGFGVGLLGKAMSGYVEFSRPLDGQNAGLDEEIRFYDLNNLLQFDQMGTCGERREFKKAIDGLATGLITDVTYLGYEDQPVTRYDGVRRKSVLYDDGGNRTEVDFFGPNGNRAMSNGKVARVIYDYENGSLAKTAFFALDTLKFPETELAKEMYEGWTMVYNSQGQVTVETHLGSEGKPAPNPATGYPKTTWEYRSPGKPDLRVLLGHGRKPLLHKVFRYAGRRLQTRKDDHQTTSEESYVGADNAPVVNNMGFGKMVSVFDKNDDMVQQRFYDLAGNPMSHKDSGCFMQTWG